MAKTMRHDTSGLSIDFTSLLDVMDYPAILLSSDYQVLASNRQYRESYGEPRGGEHCYQISHGYDRPCDQAGESCPLTASKGSGEKERVLHIHNSPLGREHIEVEMLPLRDELGNRRYFIEILKPVAIASAEAGGREMVGVSSVFNRMLELINLVAPRETSVLLLGESGTGKELAARAIHTASARRQNAMITVECAGLTETLFESELFGHIKGAFTGAVQNKPGLLEAAEGGSLFLDEIGDVPLGMQVKLLRLLETGSYRAVGSTELRRADFRLICATHKDLRELVAHGEFRQDLYYRINAFPVILPPLRDRREDIALLARSIFKKLSPEKNYCLSDKALARLGQQQFPGNIRELRNILERAMIFAQDQLIDENTLLRCLPDTVPSQFDDEPCLLDLRSQEQRYLHQLLAHCDGDKARAAEIAGISLRSFYRRLGS